jgi:hypothetical protein
VTASPSTPSLLDELMPTYDVNEVHEAWVRARPADTYAAVHELTPSDVAMVRPLMALRSLPGRLTGSPLPITGSDPAIDQMLGMGFATLGERPGTEIVVGAVGRFWSLTGNRPLSTVRTGEAFVEFDEPGFAKAAMNFAVRAERGGARIVTETRILGTDPGATWRFRLYWLIIGPWSALIRRAALGAIRRRALTDSAGS